MILARVPVEVTNEIVETTLKFGRDKLLSASELAEILSLSPATLADWRTQKRGPAYINVGRKIWYPKQLFDSWMEAQIQEAHDHGNQRTSGQMALPVQTQRKNVRRNHRLGRHTTKQDRRDGHGEQAQTRSAQGQDPSRRVEVREFNDAAADFLEWAKSQYRQHPNSFMRIKTSFTSLKEFLGKKPVSLIDEGDLEDFKAWRVNEHDVRDVTIRHATYTRYQSSLAMP